MMAKTKNNKILAMALCASVMAGIYASPVFAGSVDSITGDSDGVHINIGYQMDEGTSVNEGTINGSDGLYVTGALGNSDGALNHKIAGKLTITSEALVNALENKSFENLTVNNLNTTELTVNGETVDLSQLADVDLSNVAGIKRDAVEGTTTIEGVLNVDSTGIYNTDGTFSVDADGNVDATSFHATTGDVTTATTSLNDVGSKTQNIDADRTTAGTTTFNGNVNVGGTVSAGAVTANEISTTGGLFYASATGDVSATSLKTSGDVVAGTTSLKAVGEGLDTVEDKVAVVDDRTQNIDADRTTAGTTTFTGNVNVDGTVSAGGVIANEISTTGGMFSVDGSGVVNANDVLVGDTSLKAVGENTAGIKRTGNSKNTYTVIEDTLKVRDGYISNANETFVVNSKGDLKAANGHFHVDRYGNTKIDGNVTMADGATVDGVDVSKLNSTVEGTTTNLETLNAKTQNIDVDRTTAGTTTFTGNVDVDGTVINAQGINANSSDTFKVGQINVSGRNMSNVGYISGNTLNFKTINMGADGNDTLAQITADKVRAYNTAINAETGALTGADGSVIGGVEFSQGLVDGIDMSNLGGIEREELANGTAITTIEGVTSFDQSGMGIYTESGTTTMTGGQATFMEKDGSFTQIMGGAITAETLNGKDINDLVVGADIEDDLANVGGISRQQDENGVFYTNVEGTLTVSEKGLAGIVDDNAINLNSDGINLAAGSNAISITDAGIGFAGTVYTGNANDFHFTYNGFAGVGGTNIAAGNYTLSDLVDTVADIYDRTQGISYENGTTTVDGNLNVQGDASTGEGGNINAESGTIGDVTMSDGNINTDGVVNAGSGTIGEVTMENGNINTDGVINAGGGTIGDVTMSDGNINTDGVINAAGGGTIGGATVDKDGNINTDGVINAGGGTIGDVTMSNGAVTAGQTTVNNEGVSIANSTIISDHDVVINEGTDERVSLADVGNRVGNLEQSVSDLSSKVNELDDRIDKVGAMAAAIANLRTMGYDPAAPTEVAVGLGQYRDETGAALGLFHYPNRDFMLSLSVSTSGDEYMGGIGATWKFGRKSPEKVAEIKKAQAEADARRAEEQKLAKAEEMKKAAKEAKVQAQMERHAKLAAERAALEEA